MGATARTAIFAATVAALIGAGPATAASKKKLPDLVVTAVSPGAPSAGAGSTVAIGSTVRNAGRATSRASVVRVYVAVDRQRRGERALDGSRSVAKLRIRRSVAGKTTFTVPATLPQGVYLVFACADADRKVRESKETNNCRGATSKLTVVPPLTTPSLGGETTVEAGGSTTTGGGDTAGSDPGPGAGTGPGPGAGTDPGPGPGNPDPPPANPDRDGDGTPNGADCAPDDATIHPGADDRPDGGFVDRNCDGSDGDATKAVHVDDLGGADNGTCGERATPCKTITHGLTRATALARGQVYVAAGDYDAEPGGLRLTVPVSVYGGFGSNWVRAAGNQPTTVVGVNNMDVSGRSEAVGLLIVNPSAPIEVADLTINGVNATGTTGGVGKGSYGVLVRNVQPGRLALRRLKITAGNGTAGTPGAGATDVIQTPVTNMHGTPGGNSGLSTATVCNTSFGAGGAGGTSVFGEQAGSGGNGGREDTVCPGGGATANTGGTPPEAGKDGFAGPGPRGGGGGAGGQAGTTATEPDTPCGPGADGTPGTALHGAPGVAAGAGGALQGSSAAPLWAGRTGGDGLLGQNGGAGGGGGGSGACELDNGAYYGSGGGGGGAGGFANGVTGKGGRGGGGSFPVYVFDSSATLDSLTLVRGNGGNGGAAGAGGLGGTFGGGGAGGSGPNNNPLLKGGRGGHGAPGGNSGAGAGGSGGLSVGVYLTPASAVSSSGVAVSGGAAGAGGAGGVSDLPVANGQPGANGSLSAQAQCAAHAAC